MNKDLLIKDFGHSSSSKYILKVFFTEVNLLVYPIDNTQHIIIAKTKAILITWLNTLFIYSSSKRTLSPSFIVLLLLTIIFWLLLIVPSVKAA